MEARFRPWWQKIQKHWRTIIVAAIGVVFIAWIIAGVLPNGTGFNGYNQVTIAHTISGPSTGTVTRTEVLQPGKTFWDLLQLLIIPFVLAIIAIFFNKSERKNEQRIASDNQQEAALQEYIKEMSELLLERNLRESDEDAEVRKIARVRTLTVLPRLDGKRKRNLLLFLYEADLINRGHQIINVSDADLSGADLSGVSLRRTKWITDSSSKMKSSTIVAADLSGVNLRNANLNGANLSGIKLGAEGTKGAENAEDEEYMIDLMLEISDKGYLTEGTIRADLSGAKLVKADLSNAVLGGVDLRGADLSYANLSGANLSEANLRQANLSGANFRGANLRRADLKNITGITSKELNKQAKSLKGATMP